MTRFHLTASAALLATTLAGCSATDSGFAYLGPIAKSQEKIIGELMRQKKFHTQPFAAMA